VPDEQAPFRWSRNLFTTFFDEFLRVNGAEVLDNPASQEFLDSLLLGRQHGAVEQVGAELSKFAILNPRALGGDPFPGAQGSKRADLRLEGFGAN
jgi:hypothetical protein